MNKAAIPQPIATDRVIRVFVSSTFRDMVEDRDALMSHAWPELRRFCRERHVELVEVDLRWGITEEQGTRRETLKLCLDEIRAPALRPGRIAKVEEGAPGHVRVVEHAVENLQFGDRFSPLKVLRQPGLVLE